MHKYLLIVLALAAQTAAQVVDSRTPGTITGLVTVEPRAIGSGHTAEVVALPIA